MRSSPSTRREVVRSFLWLAAAAALGACAGADQGATTDTAVTDSAPADTASDDVILTFDSFFFEVDDTAPTTAPTTAPDSSDDTTAPDDTSETSESCRTFGCQCASNADCLDELCIEAADGSICTRTCVADCPPNFDCLTATSFGDPTTVCVPRHTRLCRPCRSDAECQATNDAYPAYCLAAADPDQGRFCGSSCANRDCPEGYSCQDAPTSGGGTAKQCVPDSGMCECRASWAALGFSTDCVTRNAVGGCAGTRQCGADGLTACNGVVASVETCDGLDNDCNGATDDIAATACTVDNANGHCPGTMGCGKSGPTCIGPTPAPETCNGLDDNCNGSTDEAGCDDGLTCTNDVCAGPGNCQNSIQSGYCVINHACWASPQYNPQNACEICDANKSTTSWSQTPNTCVIGGMCYPASAPNPLNACQICNPNQSTTSWTTSSNTCQIAGQCYLQNDINPTNSCQICAPATSTTTWTLAFNTCNIQGTCYAAGAKQPGNDCYICDPSRSSGGWSTAANGASCSDSNACSNDDKCNGAGSCVGTTTCDDGIACTTDVCNAQTGCSHPGVTAGSCRINNVCYANGTANPANPCQLCNASVSQTAWSSQGTAVSCSDGNACTINDHCSGSGTCTSGALNTCDDGKTCTTDTCNTTTGACTHATQAGTCLIDGNTCYANGATAPGNVCQKCASSLSQSAWSLNNGASCSDGDVCTSGDVCSNNVCGGTAIPDGYEVNNASTSPKWLGTQDDSSNWPQWSFADAYLYPQGDIDWYEYEINDTIGGNIEPYVSLDEIDAGHDYQLCVYFYCVNKATTPSNLDCSGAGGVSAGTITVGGRTYAGCCSDHAGNAAESMRFAATSNPFGSSQMECPSTDDHFRALVSVKNQSTNWSCSAPYRLQVGDD